MIRFLRKPLFLSLALVFILLIANALIDFRNTRQLHENANQVVHAQKILNSLDNLKLAIAQTEAAQRGYLITGETRYLDLYLSAANAIKGHLEKTLDLTKGDPGRPVNISGLEKYIFARMDNLQRESGLWMPDQNRQQRIDLTDEGQKFMENIQEQIAKIEQRENNLLLVLQQQSHTTYARAIKSGGASSLAGLVMAGAFVFFWRRDLSGRKMAEEALKRTAEELDRSNKELEQFAYIASHDLQEPLRTIMGFLQLLSERYKGRLDEKADRYISYAVEGADRMSTLIRDLLSYSRVNTRGERFQQTQAGESLEFALKNLSSAVQQSGCRIMQDQLPTVYADKIQLAQLFQNLIGNAIKYRMPGRNPEIRISVRQDIEEGCFVFNIEDNGIGFEQQYEEKIFRIFQRLHSRNKYTGTGIGLAICKRIVERHGGRIWAVGKPNEGSVFSFTIPMHGINYDERNRRLAAH
jgi:signal transduction histidine kinase